MLRACETRSCVCAGVRGVCGAQGGKGVGCGPTEAHEDCSRSKGQVPAALEQMTLSDKAKQSNSCNFNELTFSAISKKKYQANTTDHVREATPALCLKLRYSWTIVLILTVRFKQLNCEWKRKKLGSVRCVAS